MERETLRYVNINGQTCTLFYESYHWYVWLKDRGNIGVGTNAEDAIKDARATLSKEAANG